MDATLVVPYPSPLIGASDTKTSDDELFQSMQNKHASLASETALPQGNIIVQAFHISNAEQGNPSSHIQPMHETALARDISMPPL